MSINSEKVELKYPILSEAVLELVSKGAFVILTTKALALPIWSSIEQPK